MNEAKVITALAEMIDPSKAKNILEVVNEEFFKDLLCIGFEGDMTSCWAEVKDHNKKEVGAEYFHECPVKENGYVTLVDAEHEDDWEVKLTLDNLKTGLVIMMTKYPWHFADAVTENSDSITGDVFIQCCAFSEVVYG